MQLTQTIPGSSTPLQQPQPPASPSAPTPAVQVSQPAPTMPPSRKHPNIILWSVGIFFLLLMGAVGLYFVIPKNEIIVGDQVPGESIHFKKLKLIDRAILVVSRVSVDEGSQYVASSARLIPEEYTEFDLAITNNVVSLESGDKLIAVLHKDIPGEQSDDVTTFPRLKDIFGRDIRVTFFVR